MIFRTSLFVGLASCACRHWRIPGQVRIFTQSRIEAVVHSSFRPTNFVFEVGKDLLLSQPLFFRHHQSHPNPSMQTGVFGITHQGTVFRVITSTIVLNGGDIVTDRVGLAITCFDSDLHFASVLANVSSYACPAQIGHLRTDVLHLIPSELTRSRWNEQLAQAGMSLSVSRCEQPRSSLSFLTTTILFWWAPCACIRPCVHPPPSKYVQFGIPCVGFTIWCTFPHSYLVSVPFSPHV